MTATKVKSVCFICLKRFGGPVPDDGVPTSSGSGYQCRILVPYTGLGQVSSSSPSEDNQQAHSTDLYSRFLLLTSRYLKVPLAERLLDSAKEQKSSTGKNAQAFCESCEDLVGYLCDLYAELQTVKLHLLRKVDELEKVTRSSTKKVSLKLARGLVKSVAEQLNIKSTRQLDLYRKNLMLNCSRKTRGGTPKVLVHRGLFPDQWKYTYAATKQSLMRLIMIFALATPPRKRESIPEPGGILKPKGKIKFADDRRRVAFEDIAHHFYGVNLRPKRKVKSLEGVVKRETGTTEDTTIANSDGEDNDGGGAFPDTGDDNDSDWSTGAASPTRSLDSAGSDGEGDPPVPRKRKKRATRYRLSSGSSIKIFCDEDESEEDDDDDPDFKSENKKPKKGLGKYAKRPPPLDLNKAKIPCKYCSRKFIDRRGLAKHLRDIHNTSLEYDCDVCGLKCPTHTTYLEHRRTVHPGASFTEKGQRATLPCPKCKRIFVDARGLSRHMQGSHNSRLEYTCSMCGHKSKSAAEHMSHRTKMHRKRQITRLPRPKGLFGRLRRGLDTACRICEEQFPSRMEYLRHNREVHNSNHHRYECPVCMKQITNDQRFKRHLAMHEKDTNELRCFHCEVCGKTFYNEGQLTEHFDSVHEGSYSCQLCDVKYPASKMLRVHLETHETDQKNFFCPFCFRGYTGEQYFQIHRKVAHVGSERMFCDQDQCAEEFSSVQDLNEHLKKHLEEMKGKEGQQNGEGTDSKSGPTDEDKTETDKKDDSTEHNIYTCGTCGWGFINKYSLVIHELVHIPWTPDVGYRCPKEGCDKIVRLKDKLISHYNHFHGAKYKPYTCNECGNRFSHFIWFKTHLRLHEERKSGRKFICDICNFECLDSVNLAAHKRSHNNPGRGSAKASWVNADGAPKDDTQRKRRPGRPAMKSKTEEEIQKEKEEAEKRAVLCEICEITCESGTVLRKHLDKEHEQVPDEEKTIQCNFCYLKFKHELTHRLHCTSIHMQTYRFVCDAERCDEKFGNYLELNEHLKKVHLEAYEEEELNKQEITENKSSDNQSTDNQANTAMKVKSLAYCKICGWGFVNPDILELHELCHTPYASKATYPCPRCEETFPSTTRMIKHYNLAHGKNLKPYKCVECAARFFSKEGLRFHTIRHERRRNMNPNEKLICIDCGKLFMDMYLLKQHQKIHDPANHLLCPEGCGEYFVSRLKLTTHLKKKHGQGERYPCEVCGMTFVYDYETKKHMEWVHGPPKFECDVCGNKYKRPNGLRRHKRIHDPNPNAIESYMCAECGANYKSEEGLKFHIASKHTPDHLKKFSCPHCSYRTHRRMLLKMHMKVCCRNKGVPYDEKTWGKLPVVKPYTGPPRKRGRRPQKRKEDSDEEEEEMEDKSTTEDEEEEEKPSAEETPQQQQQQHIYLHQLPQSAPSTSSANVINAIIANLTGIPEVGLLTEENPQGSQTRRGRRGNARRQSKETSSTSTIDHTAIQSITQQHSLQQHQLPTHPQLFGNPPGSQYHHGWMNAAGNSGQATSAVFPFPFQQHQQQTNDNSNEAKPFNNVTPPPLHHHQQQQNAVYSPHSDVYSPPLQDQPRNSHYSARK